MTDRVAALLEQVRELRAEEQAELAREIFGLLEADDIEAPSEVEAEWIAEIQRRANAVREDGRPSSSWADVRARVLARLRTNALSPRPTRSPRPA